MRSVLNVRLPSHRKREHASVDRKHIQKGIEPILIQKHEADQHEAAGQQVSNIKRETLHFTGLAKRKEEALQATQA